MLPDLVAVVGLSTRDILIMMRHHKPPQSHTRNMTDSRSENANCSATTSNAQWWAAWKVEHHTQIDAYNQDVVENRIWSDGLGSF